VGVLVVWVPVVRGSVDLGVVGVVQGRGMVRVVVVVGIMVVTEAIMAAAIATGMVKEVVHTIMVQAAP